MDCPVCGNVKLMMAERQGIEIDYCPTCRGVWLDRGELDKLIEKSASEIVPSPTRQSVQSDPYREQRESDEFRRSQRQRGYSDDDHYYKKKRKGFLGELFDFD